MPAGRGANVDSEPGVDEGGETHTLEGGSAGRGCGGGTSAASGSHR